MTKMKKRSIITVLAVLCIITSCFVGSTFAKYTSTASGSATATVATWNITAQGNNDDDEVDLTVDSAEVAFTLVEAASTVTDTLNDLEDEDVNEGVIAPGTKGSFDLVVNNTSDVTATYTIVLTPVTTGAPVTFTCTDADVVVTTDASSGVITMVAATPLAKLTGTAEITINWEWAIGTAGSDNEFAGQTGEEFATFEITVEQVD